MTTLTVNAEPGGRFPGALDCGCGTVALAIWDPMMGAKCSGCGTCFVTAEHKAIYRAGEYRMVRGPNVPALSGNENMSRDKARKNGAWR